MKFEFFFFSAGFQTLAKMYAAEAQMYLANTNEALNLLLEPKKNNFHDMTFTENSDSNNTPNNDLASQSNVAKTIFQVNLAVAFILQVCIVFKKKLFIQKKNCYTKISNFILFRVKQTRLKICW